MAKAKRLTTLEVGETYFVETCTKDWVGRLVECSGPYTVVLEDASWVANSGRMSTFMAIGNGGAQMEIEPVGIVCAQWVNWMPWPFALPKEAI